MLTKNEIDVLSHELLYIAVTDCTDMLDDNDDEYNFLDDLHDKIDCYKHNIIQIIKLCDDYDLHIKMWGRSDWNNTIYDDIYDLNDCDMFGDDDLIWLLDKNNDVVLVINDYCQPIELSRYDCVINNNRYGHKICGYNCELLPQSVIDKYGIIDME